MNETLKATISKQFRNTTMGFLRIKRNINILHLSNKQTESYLEKIILSTPIKDIQTKGKNYYFECIEYNVILTINSHTFTIITAKQIVK